MTRQLHVSVGKSCISAGFCRNHAPEVFAFKAPRSTVVRADPVADSPQLQLAMESCPVEAISARDAETGDAVFP